MICYNHHPLSFTLKDGIERLSYYRPLPIVDEQFLEEAQPSAAYSDVFEEHRQASTLPLEIEFRKRSNDLPSKRSRPYAGGIIATWYKKVILTIHTIPSDWYGWRGTKLDTDYLLIDEKLLPDIAIILKVCNLNTLVVYSKKAHPLGYTLNTKKLGIKLIWLKLGSKKTLTWSKNL